MKLRGSLKNTSKTFCNKLENLEEMDKFINTKTEPGRH
jgi:hypothetical protein